MHDKPPHRVIKEHHDSWMMDMNCQRHHWGGLHQLLWSEACPMIVATAGWCGITSNIILKKAFSVVQILSYFYKAGYLEVISQALSLECKVRFSLQLRLFWGWPLHPLHLCATVVRGWLGRRNVRTPAIQRDVMDVIVWSILIGPLVSPLCDGKTFGVSLFNSEHDDNCCHL